MNGPIATLSRPAVPAAVQEFATEKGVSRYVNAVIDLAQQAFPSSTLTVSLGQDVEDELHRYIALDVEASGQTADGLLRGQRIWSSGLPRVCPPGHAVYFVLGWR